MKSVKCGVSIIENAVDEVCRTYGPDVAKSIFHR